MAEDQEPEADFEVEYSLDEVMPEHTEWMDDKREKNPYLAILMATLRATMQHMVEEHRDVLESDNRIVLFLNPYEAFAAMLSEGVTFDVSFLTEHGGDLLKIAVVIDRDVEFGHRGIVPYKGWWHLMEKVHEGGDLEALNVREKLREAWGWEVPTE